MKYTSEEIYSTYLDNNKNKTTTAKKLNIDWDTVNRHVKKMENLKEDEFVGEFEGENLTEEKLFEKFNLNSKEWQIERIIHNSWETPIKLESGEITAHTNNQSKVIFKKILSNITLDIIKEQYKLLPKKYEPIKRINKPNPCMLELAITDHHFAKLAWDLETGDSYDIKIAKRYYINAIKDLLLKTAHLNVEKILMPIGNDLFNFDGIKNETTAGTPQDSDSRWTKIFRIVSETMIEVIDICREIADVDVIIVPGNHDRASCFYLGEFLSAWYRLDKNVNINNDPTLRKYYVYGKTLLGMTHGSEEKQGSLPLLMAREAKTAWSICNFYEYQLGHWHKKKMTEYISGDTYNGVQIRILPSLTGTDAWHYSKGYVKGIKSALGIVYDKEEGCIAEFISKVID